MDQSKPVVQQATMLLSHVEKDEREVQLDALLEETRDNRKAAAHE
jgi:hypothetical protein